ncbi:MAG: peptide chain release factor-like protein [Candidatus Margulisiibacteriota bacterium]
MAKTQGNYNPLLAKIQAWFGLYTQKFLLPQSSIISYNTSMNHWLNKKDVIEKFIRSGGPGGQNVNKTSTCVYLKHIPTGIEVKVSRERSQAINRLLAWRKLEEKIKERVLKIKTERQRKIEKIRRQKRRRSKRAKEKILKYKKKQSEKKRSRRISSEDLF